MAINISSPLKRTGAYPVDETIVLTKEEMKAINDNTMPEVYFTLCKDDGKLYIYNKNNSIDESTGKFREMESGSVSLPIDYEQDEQVINRPSINNIELLGDKTSEDLGLQGEIDDITPQDIDKIIYGG